MTPIDQLRDRTVSHTWGSVGCRVSLSAVPLPDLYDADHIMVTAQTSDGCIEAMLIELAACRRRAVDGRGCMSDEMSAAEYVASQTRGNKYGAIRTEVDGITFDSKAEARRYGELKLMADAGIIRELVLQPEYSLATKGNTIGKYIADFAYIDNETGRRVVEDVKGRAATMTPLYRWKKRHMKAQYNIDIVEVEA